MRRNYFCIMMAAAMVVLFSSQQAMAQRRPSVNPFLNILDRPTVSPYLNLLRNQGVGAPNYQTLVRPELEARRQFEQQQRQINNIESTFSQRTPVQTSDNQIRATGHRTLFRDYSHYYPILQNRNR